MDGRLPPIDIAEPQISHPMAEVESSAVSHIGWDGEQETLYVRWKTTGMTYIYFGVSEADFAAVMDAPSIGAHMNRVVKKFKHCLFERE